MARKTRDPGFGYQSKQNAKDIINDDGSSNVVHLNRKRSINDLYAYFVDISWWHFFLLIIFTYTLINIIFGLIYVSIGIEQITKPKGTFLEDFLNGFFFSAQTLTTVGYGGIAPKGITANFVAAFEAMIGLLSFSFITGLLYGRFSKPKAKIKFSDNLILRKFKKERAIMFRLMNKRKTVMIEPEIKVTLSISEKDKKGAYTRNFYTLKLEREKIMYLPTIWTVVHEIDEKSPLYDYSDDKIENLDAFLYILISYHEESFAQKVYQIYSYDFDKLETNVKYVPAASFDEDGFTILDHESLSKVETM
ncbi:ion channel [Polaribacter aquimarinus]|uniref:Ion transporter n=1 Tax=Polaribacter aquimarinus TaxID=2100726 RepID=A0A2U2JEQ6_9FLAO|nr:ion channel [Polaribacter aquimarinus]PWG06819.1 ion transporter [Polaribacter aquimarinus]